MSRVSLIFIVAAVLPFAVANKVRRDVDLDVAPRVIGPQVIEANDPNNVHDASRFKYQISFQDGCGHFCGGTIVSSRIIVTAAHCTAGKHPKRLTIRAGSLDRTSGGQVRSVFAYYMHPEYNRGALINDIAILLLQDPLDLTDLTVATLPKQGESFMGEHVDGSGWADLPGHEQKQFLAHANMTVFKTGTCSHPSRLCTLAVNGYEGTCMGDSGGPLVYRRGNEPILIGVASAVIKCAQPGYPLIWADVANLRSWVDATMVEAEHLLARVSDKNKSKLTTNSC